MEAQEEKIYKGIPVAGGVAIGRVRLLSPTSFAEPITRRLTKSDVATELARYKKALDQTRSDLQILMQKLESHHANSSREILEMHLLVLEDSYINDTVTKFVSENYEGAESAYYRVIKNCVESFQQIPDAYMRERALDIKDVAQRVMRHLNGEKSSEDAAEDSSQICVALDLTPSETVQLDRERVLGFAVGLGSAISHTAILAKSLGLPAVVRVNEAYDELKSGDHLLLDGYRGLLIRNPSQATLERYAVSEAQTRADNEALMASTTGPVATKDGFAVTVAANAEFVSELRHIKEYGGEGIGLFRTEFHYLENPNSCEEAMFEVYKEVVLSAHGKLVIFRTLDVGGDKLELDRSFEESELNPFLGWRGIRVSLDKTDHFKRQLRAILRASALGTIGVMYPMVSTVHEVENANRLLRECQVELAENGVDFDPNIQVGVMIEVPSAALIADLLAPHVNFFSIGTNDLVQYSMAVDRVNQRVSYLYNPCNPAVLRLIQMTVKAAKDAGIWVGMCGEMAGDLELTPLLIGLGLNELSTAVPQIPKLKHAIKQLSREECEQLVSEALYMQDTYRIRQCSAEMAQKAYPEFFNSGN